MSSQCFIIGLSALVILGLSSKIEGRRITERLGRPPFKIRIQQCREGCLEKFAIKEALCQQRPECSMCWDECAKPPPPKINKTILETWALHTVSMHRKGSLVLVDVAWAPFNTPNQCLVTWEVSGGGLMGNLLTESTNVQLSLWPDTKYRVQVTCKNKITEAMSRSLPLTIDTSEANSSVERESPSTSISLPSSPLAVITSSPNTSSSTVIALSSSSSLPPSSSSSGLMSLPSTSSLPTSSLSSATSTITTTTTLAQTPKTAAAAADRNQSFHLQSNTVNNEHTAVTTLVTTTSASGDFIETHLNNDFDHFDWRYTRNGNGASGGNSYGVVDAGDDEDDHHDSDDDNEVTVDKIAISNSDIKILTISALSRTQTPLIYGIVAGTFLLTVILFLHVCVLRSRRIPSDKKALIDDDGNATNNMLSSSLIAGSGICGGMTVTNHFGTDVPIDPVMYSRTVHVLTV